MAAKAAAECFGRLRGARGLARSSSRMDGTGEGFRGDFSADIVCPVFRATSVAWAAAEYPAYEEPLRIAAISARDFAQASAEAVRAAGATSRAVNAAFAATVAADTTKRIGNNDTERAAGGATFATIYSTDATPAAAVWAAVSLDAARVEEGATASLIAGLPLWPQHQFQPELLQSLWQEMKAALVAASQDWQFWINWYEDRLAGRVQDEARELVYALLRPAVVPSPAKANANIKRLIEGLEAAPPPIDP